MKIRSIMVFTICRAHRRTRARIRERTGQAFFPLALIVVVLLVVVGLSWGGTGIFSNPFTGLNTTSSPQYSPYQDLAQDSSQDTIHYVPPAAPAAIAPQDIPAGFAPKDISPYFHMVRLGSVSASSGGSPGQIHLSASGLGEGGAMDVTGWLIAGDYGSHYVPQAVNIYHPSGLTAPGDIYLRNGDSVTMYASASPVGNSLRMNTCIGYLDTQQVFSPPLPRNCATQNIDNLFDVTEACRNYMRSLGSCELPSGDPPIPVHDSACRARLQRWNYAGCFSEHQRDPDFLGSEWRAFVGASQFFNASHDRLVLFDRQGKVVDVTSY